MSAALIVGADGSIGRPLFAGLRQQGWNVVGTSRRSGAPGLLALDLAQPPDLHEIAVALDGLRQENVSAFLLAGVTGYAQCEHNPGTTRRVNVENTIALAQWLLDRGVFVTFPSSTAVFSPRQERPAENEQVQPITEYGRQKAETEARLLAIAAKAQPPAGAAVLRVTKVMHSDIEWFAGWVRSLQLGRPIQASAETEISPVSRRATMDALVLLAVARRTGVFHFSGEGQVSYFVFAQRLAVAMGVDPALVKEQVIQTIGDGSKSAALAMSDTSLQCGLRPQAVHLVIEDVMREFTMDT